MNFWKDLDYIEVDAYFPLNENRSSDIDELRAGWQPYKKELRKLSRRNPYQGDWKTINLPLRTNPQNWWSKFFTEAI